MRTCAALLLSLTLAPIGCAHSAQSSRGESKTAEDGVDLHAPLPETSRVESLLRHENETLRRRIATLEERLRMAEGGGGTATVNAAAAPAAINRGSLPVVKLQPEVAGSEPATSRGSVSLNQVPGSDLGALAREAQSPYAATTAAEQSSGAASGELRAHDDPVGSEFSAGADDSKRSFKLVGSRLVELSRTQRKPTAKAPPAPKPRRQAVAAKPKPKKAKRLSVVGEYEAARDVYKAGAFAESEVMFAAFVSAHPRHDYADNALYWQGESAYDQGHYADALAAFTAVVERYGGGNKAPDALLKIGLCYRRTGDQANAKDVLTQLVAAYPRANASRIAKQKLIELEAG